MLKIFQNQFARNSTFPSGDEDVWILMSFPAASLRFFRRKWRNINLLPAAWFHLADYYREKCCYRSDQKRAHLTLAEFPIMFWLHSCDNWEIISLQCAHKFFIVSESHRDNRDGYKYQLKVDWIYQTDWNCEIRPNKSAAKDKTEANENAENGEIICVLSRS